MRLKIKIVNQLFPKENDIGNKENSFRIFSASPIGKYENVILNNRMQFSIKGELPYLDVGSEYDVEMRELEVNKWGGTYSIEQVFNFQDFKDLTLDESRDILYKMASPKNVETLLNVYPNFINLVLTNGKSAIDTSLLYNIKDAKLSSYIRQLNEKFKYYSIMQSFKKYELSIEECRVLCERYNSTHEISTAIEKSPYSVLIDVLGRPFIGRKSVDSLLLVVRPELKESEERCTYLMLEVLKLNEVGDNGQFKGGSTRLNGSVLYEYCKNYAPELCSMMKKVAIKSSLIYYDEETKDMARWETYEKERKIANFISTLLNKNTKLDWDWKKFTEIKDGTLTEEQQQVLKSICENRITILEAPSGSGKSSTAMAITNMIEHYGESFVQMVGTGKGARRLKETSKRDAFTIHRVLLKNKGTNATFVIIDEYSFLSIDLMDLAIQCILNEENVRVIFIGNIDQIPPVSIGMVGVDLLDCGKINTVRLTKCFRFDDGGMAMCAEKCRRGDIYLEGGQDVVTYGKDEDYIFYQSNGTIKQIGEVYMDMIKEYNCKPKDIVILSPYNTTDLGTRKINKHIQSLINPPLVNEISMNVKSPFDEITFRKGDLVLNTKNVYDAITEDIFLEMTRSPMLSKSDFDGQLEECANGEVGRVLEVQANLMKIQFDENILIFFKADAKNLLLGYSISIHRLQGSETPYSIVITSNQHKKHSSREMLYVALTRARKVTVQIGDIEAINHAVNTRSNNIRNTFLRDMLNNIEIKDKGGV